MWIIFQVHLAKVEWTRTKKIKNSNVKLNLTPLLIKTILLLRRRQKLNWSINWCQSVDCWLWYCATFVSRNNEATTPCRASRGNWKDPPEMSPQRYVACYLLISTPPSRPASSSSCSLMASPDCFLLKRKKREKCLSQVWILMTKLGSQQKFTFL